MSQYSHLSTAEVLQLALDIVEDLSDFDDDVAGDSDGSQVTVTLETSNSRRVHNYESFLTPTPIQDLLVAHDVSILLAATDDQAPSTSAGQKHGSCKDKHHKRE